MVILQIIVSIIIFAIIIILGTAALFGSVYKGAGGTHVYPSGPSVPKPEWKTVKDTLTKGHNKEFKFSKMQDKVDCKINQE